MKLRNKKTGELVDAWSFNDGNKSVNLKYFTNDGQVNLEYRTLAELNGEWEDYEPPEPLIKDEKTRKLVKEWATLFEEHRKIKYYEYNDFVVFRLCREKGTPDPELDISIDYELVNLKEGYEYDFEELCGEE